MCSLFCRHNMPSCFHFQNAFPYSIFFVGKKLHFLKQFPIYIFMTLANPNGGGQLIAPYRPPDRATAPETDSLLAKKNVKLVSRSDGFVYITLQLVFLCTNLDDSLAECY